MRTWLAALALLWLALPAFAVNPDEMLSDPALEARARTISEGLRCLVCQNESIDDSDADLAHEIRVLVRERLKAGDTDDEVRQYLVDRYGEFVLLRPTFSPGNAALWAGPFLVVLLGAGLLLVRLRNRAPEPELDAAEDERLQSLQDEQT